jgi:hypothetical protein
MAKSTSTANWQTIDPETLPTPVAKQYARYKATYKEMKMDRDAFEQAMRDIAPAPAGKRLVFGYNFGKLSVALVDDEVKPSKLAGTLSLSAFLATQSAQGKRT